MNCYYFMESGKLAFPKQISNPDLLSRRLEPGYSFAITEQGDMGGSREGSSKGGQRKAGGRWI